MTELRKRMLEDLQLAGKSPRTQVSYVRAVRQLAEHFNKSPGLITEHELREYFLYVKNVKGWSRSTLTLAICGIKFFCERTLKRSWTTLDIIRPQKEKKLPVILARTTLDIIRPQKEKKLPVILARCYYRSRDPQFGRSIFPQII
jgi:hypothetical protein